MERKKDHSVIIVLVFFLIVIFLLLLILLIVLFDPNSASSPSTPEMDHSSSAFNRVSKGYNLRTKSQRHSSSFSHKFGIGPSLVSDFGSKEFKCTGSCSCVVENDDDERRNVLVSSAKKSVFYVISAISAVSAVHIAKTKFEDKCHVEFRDTCLTGTITSEVDRCNNKNDDQSFTTTKPFHEIGVDILDELDYSKVGKSDFVLEWEERYKDKIDQLSEDEKVRHYEDLNELESGMDERSFHCEGSCLKSAKLPNIREFFKLYEGKEDLVSRVERSFLRKISSADEKCVDQKMDKSFRLETPSAKFLKSDQTIYERNLLPDHFAMDYFEKTDLHTFCVEIGLSKIFEELEEEFKGELEHGSFDLPGICVSHNPPHHNPSVQCKEVVIA